MDEHSVVLLNYGLHFAEALNFSNYRILMDKVVKLLKDKSAYRPSVIWRTTTALNRHKYSVPYLHSRRFLTPQVCTVFKGSGSRNVNKLLSKGRFCFFLIGHITVIFHYFSQNESVILKMESCTS